MQKCYRLGCKNEVVGKYKDIKSLCYLDPVCAEHQVKEDKAHELDLIKQQNTLGVKYAHLKN